MDESHTAGRSDEPGRLQALDGSQSFIVRAPAGSGKTELLVQRLLVLLTQVDAPEFPWRREAVAQLLTRITTASRPSTPQRRYGSGRMAMAASCNSSSGGGGSFTAS